MSKVNGKFYIRLNFKTLTNLINLTVLRNKYLIFKEADGKIAMMVKIHAIIIDHKDLKLSILLALPLLSEYINSFMINNKKISNEQFPSSFQQIALTVVNLFTVNSRAWSATFWGSCC